MTEKAIDILAFDAVSQCNESQPLALLDARDNEVGITLHVLGKHSDAVTKFEAKQHKRTMANIQASMRGRKVSDDEDVVDRDVEAACVRVVGWEGVKQAFTPEVMASALRRNPHWREQIFELSNDLGKFGKVPSKS